MILLDLGPLYWLLIALAFFAGGVTKGVIGMGMPLIVVPTVASFIDPVTAIALIVVPSIASNLWQVQHGGHFHRVIGRLWTLALPLAVVISLAASIVVRTGAAVAATVMGALVIVFTLSRATAFRFDTGPETERWLSPVVGAVCGLIGGITGLLSPPLSMYLVSLKLPKDEFVAAIALLLLCGGTPLFAVLAVYGILSLDVLIASAAGAVPTAVGLYVGTRLRHRISQALFERVLLVVLFVIGLNLLRRGLGL